MATISGVARPAYVYDAANNQWVPIGVGPHTHSLADLPSVVSTNGGSTIVNQAPTLKGLVIQGASGQTANLFEVQNAVASIVSYIRVDGSALFSKVTTNGVHTGTNVDTLALTSNANSSSQGTGIYMWGTSTGTYSGGIHYIGDSRGSDGHHTFWTYNGSSWNPHTRISKDGNLGIGDITSTARIRIDQRVDNSLLSMSQYKNDGGTSNMIFFNDDRNYSGTVSGDCVYGYTWDLGNNTGSLLRLERFNGSFVPAFNVKATGKVGIGINGPDAKLHIYESAGSAEFLGLHIQNGGGGTAIASIKIGEGTPESQYGVLGHYGVDNSFRIGNVATGGGYMSLHTTTTAGTNLNTGERARFESSNGYFLIGYTVSNGAYRLQVNSQIFATSGSIATSDARYKENVKELTGGLDAIKALRPVEFNWKQQEDVVVDDKVIREAHAFPEGKTVGFIAQEVQEALGDKPWVNNLVKENSRDAVIDKEGNELAPEEEFLGIAETNLIAVLVSAVKELTAKVEALEAKLAE